MTVQLRISENTLGQLLPMHLHLDGQGMITSMGPTMAKVLRGTSVCGQNVFDIFSIKHRRAHKHTQNVQDLVGGPMRVSVKNEPHSEFKAIVVALDSGGYLMSVAFGIGIIQAVADFDLSAGDFPPTDLAIELLYLNEARSAVLQESHSLIRRLQGARIAAEEKAYTDTLTGLKNRRALNFVLQRYMGTGKDFGLMNIDLDFFKEVNDTMGHAAGDYVLQYVARILLGETREKDAVARVGGDEFILVLDGMIDLQLLRAIGERIISKLERPIHFNGESLKISASIGATVSTNYADRDAQEMMHHADLALYASKRAGRAAFTHFGRELLDRRSA